MLELWIGVKAARYFPCTQSSSRLNVGHVPIYNNGKFAPASHLSHPRRDVTYIAFHCVLMGKVYRAKDEWATPLPTQTVQDKKTSTKQTKCPSTFNIGLPHLRHTSNCIPTEAINVHIVVANVEHCTEYTWSQLTQGRVYHNWSLEVDKLQT